MSDNYENIINTQLVLFKNAKRSEILSLKNNRSHKKKIYVHRNEACEGIFALAEKYFERSGLGLDIKYGDYDESLIYAEDIKCDLDVVFFNLDRLSLKQEELNEWFFSRVNVLRQRVKRVLIVYYSSKGKGEEVEKFIESKKDADFIHLSTSLGESDVSLYDLERESYTGTILSSKQHIRIAQDLGGRLIPNALKINIKAIVFDLDNTLYAGIVGEDGVSGVNINSRKELHRTLIDFKQMGILLAIASKNDFEIVNELFIKRSKEFGFDISDFTTHQIGWGLKSESIKKIANELRISEDSILFVDDNFSELLEVFSNTNLKKIIHADQDSDYVIKSLKYFPGVWRSRKGKEDELRHDDLVASVERASLNELSEEDYFKQLDMNIVFTTVGHDIDRLVDLSNKTNQYNLSLRRFVKNEFIKLQSQESVKIFSISLSDKMTNSGTIGCVILEERGSDLHVLELCISCRALGRKLESLFFLEIVKLCSSKYEKIVFHYKYSDRNQPIYNWLREFVEFNRNDSGLLSVDYSMMIEKYTRPNVKIEIR